jgi:hypothetical protein
VPSDLRTVRGIGHPGGPLPARHPTTYLNCDDFLKRGSALVGGRPNGFTYTQFVDSLELIQSDVAPALRLSIADPPWPEPIVPPVRRGVLANA